ncbi:hypothetical protein QTP86_011561 [Hemibagrus guttatus]|nr:hypothetical protein QTP86_011561 [Hemibagrus guttatus]
MGLHQGSAPSPFLFAMAMDQLSEEVRQESPWTMMFADDIVICSESREQMEENLERWRFALERRGMKFSREPHSTQGLPELHQNIMDKLGDYIDTTSDTKCQSLPPALPEGPRGVPRPAERHSLSSVSWVFPGASSRWGMPGTPLQGDVPEASETDARATSTAPFRCGGAAALLQAPPG